MTSAEIDIDPADLPGIFLYGVKKLRLCQNGLVPGVHDPDDLATIATLCVLINRTTAERDTPFDAAINGLAVLAGALIAADAAGAAVPHLVPKWRETRTTVLQLQHAGRTASD